MAIYVGYDAPTIVRYLDPSTSELFTARFADCHFDETSFPLLRGDMNASVPNERQELTWFAPTMSHYDPRTSQYETEVQRILEL